jgi:UDP-glucose 4-epimerase
MTRVLVTGGYGYIGGRLVQALASDKAFSVTIAGRLVRRSLPGVLTMAVDWHNSASLETACRAQDAVVHLAAMNEPDCEKEPVLALRSNGLATLMLLQAAQSARVKRFVYVSTSKVFGANPTGMIDESTVPHPENHYAITHRLAEDYVLSAHDKGQLQGIVLRLSNSLGAPADPGINAWMLIANDFCCQAATTKRIALKSSGFAWRNFIAMADTVAAVRHALTMSPDLLSNGLFHLGGPETLRIWDLALRIARRADKMFEQSTKVERASEQSATVHRMLEWRTDKFCSTGWKATRALDEEIDSTLRMCRNAFKRSTCTSQKSAEAVSQSIVLCVRAMRRRPGVSSSTRKWPVHCE